MNNTIEAFESLKRYLIDNYGAKTASGGKEIVKRCHICGDSRDKTDAHMYIGIKNGRIWYNCFKCNSGGLVNSLFLRNMGCYDPNIIISVQEQNKSNGDPATTSINASRARFVVTNPLYDVSYDDLTQKKLDYLEKRIGLKTSIYDAKKYKMVLNLKRFLSLNNIAQFTRHPDIVDLLDKYFIGFLSIDNTYIILRRVIQEGNLPSNIDTRYVNYNIYGLEDGSKFYTIPAQIQTALPISIHVSEGIMDILSIRHNVSNDNNGIFSAICGKSYSSLVRHYIVNYGFINFDLHLYMDNDVSDNSILRIRDDLSLYNTKIFVHRNTAYGEKDYGVTRDRICDSISIL